MTKLFFAMVIFALSCAAKKNSAVADAVQSSADTTPTVKRSLIWSEEFNVSGLPDTAKWVYDIGTGENGWGNQELEYYTDSIQNASVQDGLLKINAVKENFKNKQYTSARILTRGKFSFKYGRVEARAKLPAGVGTWPAIWMLGENKETVGWPACGEIDIMEHRGSELNKIFATLHYPGHYGSGGNGNTIMISNAATSFHIYAMEWSAAELKFYVDDTLYHSVSNAASMPFNQNFYIILNVAMGGFFAGAVDPAFTSAAMEVDYVRVYQQAYTAE